MLGYPLNEFLGADGFMFLLQMLNEGVVPKSGWIELGKRLYIPGYEVVRRHFKEAIADGVFERNTPLGFYSQSDIQATLEFARRRK